MPYDAIETSAADGRPIELYIFTRDLQVWRYTNADRDVTVASATFRARPISRSSIEATTEKVRSGLSLTVPRDLEVADLYRVAPPTQVITCTVQRIHEGDNEPALIWSGRVLGVEFAGVAARIELEPILTSVARMGLRRVYQRQCPHVLYGAACGVSLEAQRVEGVVDSIAGEAVTVPQASTRPDGFFAGGILEWPITGGSFERRFILAHTGQVLTLQGRPFGLLASVPIRMYPGCDHTAATCASKFSNVARYGGFPYMPLKNPFGGDPIY